MVNQFIINNDSRAILTVLLHRKNYFQMSKIKVQRSFRNIV